MNGAFLGTLADISIRAFVAVALVGGALAALRVRAGAVRHASWTAVLVAMLFMPALVRSVPAMTVPIPFAGPASPSTAEVDLREAAREAAATPSEGSVRGSVDSSHGIESSDATRRTATIPVRTPRVNWVLLTPGLYGLGTVVMLLRLLVGWWGAARVAASADRLASSEYLAIAHSRNIAVRESRAISVPVTVGVIRCSVLLPSGWSGCGPGVSRWRGSGGRAFRDRATSRRLPVRRIQRCTQPWPTAAEIRDPAAARPASA
jgi:beta-lactamase regulating signal transducer with metallopeptidase domain